MNRPICLVVMAATILCAGIGQAATLNAIYTSPASVPLTTGSYTATGKTVSFTLDYAPTPGTSLIVVSNTGTAFISGTFANLAQGQIVPMVHSGVTFYFVANYYGVNGRDLVLQPAAQQAWVWGFGPDGETGNNSYSDNPAPEPVFAGGVLYGKTILALAGGSEHMLALCSDGSLSAWGNDNSGQLGDNFAATSNFSFFGDAGAPEAVDTGSDTALYGKTPVAIAAGNIHSVALCSDGTVVAWGDDSSGELGDGGLEFQSPVAVAVDTGTDSALFGKTVVAVSAGGSHTVALCSDGTVATWGDNSVGELGDDGSETQSNVPVAVYTGAGSALKGKKVVAISGGGSHTLALCSDGTVAAWGDNTSGGALGDGGAETQSNVPVAVYASTGSALAGKKVVAISGGVNFSVALCSDGTVVAWGDNLDGQLGDGGSESSSNIPVAVDVTGVLAGEKVVSVAAGAYSTVALCLDNTVAAWGYNANGELGDYEAETQSNLPVPVNTTSFVTGQAFAGVAAGPTSQTILALVTAVAVPEIDVEEPAGVTLFSGAKVDFGKTLVGATNQLAFTISNTGLAPLTLSPPVLSGTDAGQFTTSQLSTGSLTYGQSTTLTAAFSPPSRGRYSAALDLNSNDPVTPSLGLNLEGSGTGGSNSVIFASGTGAPITASNYTAQGGPIYFTLNYAPTPGTILTVVNVSGLGFIDGTYSDLAQGQAVTLTYNGVTYTFFANYYGGGGNDLVLQWANTQLLGWGYNADGELGNSGTTDSLLPTPVTATGALNGKSILAASAGALNGVALTSDGKLFTWGFNDAKGELGTGGTTSSLVPVRVHDDGVFGGEPIAVSAGDYHTLALCSDGSVVAWGFNGDGELGNGNPSILQAIKPVKVQMPYGETVLAIRAGDFHSLALCSDGTVYAWGNNAFGQLGDSNASGTFGTNAGVATPIPVDTGTDSALYGETVTAIAAGGYHSLALCSDGTLVSWGNNSNGELGIGSTTNSATPVLVDTGTDSSLHGRKVIAIAAGYGHSLALCADGTLAAWGINGVGELGNGGTNGSLVPIAVNTSGALAGKKIVGLAAGALDSFVICSDGSVAAWGYNSDGELGDSGTANSLVPVTVNFAGYPVGETPFALAGGPAAQHAFALAAIPVIPQIQIQQALGAFLVSGSSPVDFGAAVVGASNQLVFTINNAGTAPLANLAISVTGTNAGDFQASPPDLTTLPPGASTTFTVTFAPTAGGERGAVLNVTSNDPVTPSFAIPLTGTAQPTFTVTPTSGGNGTISPATPQIVMAGANASFTASPGPGYVVSQWLVNDVPAQNGGNAFTLPGVTANAAVNVTFAAASGAVLSATYNSATDIPATSGSYTATGIVVQFTLNYPPAPGTTLTVVKNTGPGFINGTFANLAQGQAVVLTYAGLTYNFVANYYGGSGRDLVLQAARPTLLSWGDNVSGELGSGSLASSGTAPAPVDASGVLAGETVTSLAAGDGFSVALCADGSLASWGDNSDGELGNNGASGSAVPVPVDTTDALAGETVISVAAGDSHALALCADGTVYAWGDNDSGQLGTSITSGTGAPVPVDTSGVLSGETVVAVSAGDLHSLALCADGTLVAWGYNGDGELGDGGAEVQSDVPVSVLTGTGALLGKTVIAVAAGGAHSLALCSDGSVAAWGYNSDGELGNTGTISSLIPTLVNTAGVLANKTVVAIAAGGLHSLALCSDGTLVAWGYNADGELGNGGTSSSTTPVLVNMSGVLANKKVIAIAAGRQHSAVLCSDGTVAAWGYNADGELGDSGTFSSSVPMAVNGPGAGQNFIAIASGPSAIHTLATSAGPEPEIFVQQTAGVDLASGSNTVDFGSVLVGGSSQLTFTVENGGPGTLGNVGLSVVGSNASDFQVTASASVAVASGSTTSFTVTFSPLATGQRAATIVIASSDPVTPYFTIGVTGVGTAQLTLPTFYFAQTSTQVQNSDGQATVTVTRSAGSPATVDYQTIDATAQAGQEYTSSEGTLSFTANQMEQTIAVPILPLGSAPGNSYFTIQLMNPSQGFAIGTPASAGVYILNPDASDYGLSDTSSSPVPAPPASNGSITVNLTPAAADGQWRLFGELDWRNSGPTGTAEGLTAGNYEVEFKTAAGYQQPDLLVVPLAAGQAAVESGTYTVDGAVATGSLQVNLQPAGVGGWRLQGETAWRASGDTAMNINQGDYIVEFETVANMVTPSNCEAVVVANDIATISTTYLEGDTAVSQASGPSLVSDTIAETQSPFVYTGQIQTDDGFGTGFVPLDRVVLTAAHVIFDDSTLSFVAGVRWFSQYENGVFEAPAQIPVGSYVMDGYAAQRALDNSPGVASAASRQLDAAALYFFGPAAGGGQSGYLASDSATNIWLTGTRSKFIAGYPVEVVSPTGRLYATPIVQSPFQYVNGSVFSTNAITSYAGNSGGPLFVQFDNGTYFPAAIYLGGSGDTVVHSIDSDVINLMNDAEISGNGGANNSGGGISQVNEGLTGVLTTALGGVHVTLSPPGAGPDGAYWELAGDATKHYSGESLLGLAPGSYVVQFFTSGINYTAPANITAKVAVGVPTQVDGIYTPRQPTITSSSTATVVEGQKFTYQAVAAPEVTGYSTSSVLPSGLTLNGTTGLISGVVSSGFTPQVVPIVLQATNSVGTGKTFTLELTVALPGELIVSVNGEGTIPKLFANSTIQPVGSTISIKAAAKPGSLFANWSDADTGQILSTDEDYTFTVPTTMHLQANFVANPFMTAKGTYMALLQGGDYEHSGYVQMTVNTAGGFDAIFYLGGVSVPVKNIFNNAGQYQGGFVLPGTRLYNASLNLTGSAILTGTLTSQSDGTQIQLSAQVAAPLSNEHSNGSYTVLLPAPSGAGPLPGGNGFGTLSVSKTGGVGFKGELGDGVPVAVASNLDSKGVLQFLFLKPPGRTSGTELVEGTVAFPPAASGTAGTLYWYREPNANDPLYKLGFSTTTPFVISTYSPPAVNYSMAHVTFSGADIVNPVTKTVTISPTDKVTYPGTDKFSLTFVPSSGLFNGSFMDNTTRRAFSGVVLQSGDFGLGLFQEPNGQTGSVVLRNAL